MKVGVPSSGLIMIALIAAGCTQRADAKEAASFLSCDASHVVSTTVDHDNSTVETRTPEDQATQYAAAQRGAFGGTQRVAQKTGERLDIAFQDGQGRTMAVLSYSHDDKLGWRLSTALNCP